MPSATSIENYHAHRRSGKLGEQAQRVLDFLAENPNRNYSRAELASELSMPLASVCGRVNKLLELSLIDARKARQCGITQNTISPVRIARQPADHVTH